MKKYNIAQISFLIACGAALQLAETFIPLPVPIPGLRVGLGNVATLLGIILFGFPAGFEVAVFRPVITSLMNGTFLSPVFFLSICGSLTSFIVMAGIYFLTRNTRFMSIILIGIVGSVMHNVSQIILAYYWLIHVNVVLVFAPLMVIIAVFGGYLVGWSTKYIIEKMAEEKLNSLSQYENIAPPAPPADLRGSDKIKIAGAFVMILSTIFWKSAYAYLALIMIVSVLIIAYGYNRKIAGTMMINLWSIVAFSFALPALFSTTGDVIWQWWIFKVTYIGIKDGMLFAMRLIFLILLSAWIGVTDPKKLSEELAWILSPLKYFHFSTDRIPMITSLSLSFVPVIWDKLSKLKPKTLKTVLNTLVTFFVGLEAQA